LPIAPAAQLPAMDQGATTQPETALPAVVSPTEAARTATRPEVDLQMSGHSAHAGEIVASDLSWFGKPLDFGQGMEWKTWLDGTGAGAIRLHPADPGATSTTGSFFDSILGRSTMFQLPETLGPGDYLFHVGLIDPVTGNLISENIDPIHVTAPQELTARNVLPARPGDKFPDGSDRPTPVPDARLQLGWSIIPEWFMGDLASELECQIANIGSGEANLEIKVWLETAGVPPVPVLTLGADGSLSLSAGGALNLRPMVPNQVPSALTPGTWLLRTRVLNPASGQILGEAAQEITVR
jgi:hypothetical protein